MKKVLAILLLLSGCISTYAQDSNKELLKKLVEKQVLTEQEAKDLMNESEPEEQKNTVEKTTEYVRYIFTGTPYLQVGGYGLFMYNYSNTAEIKHDAQARVIFLSARGNLTNTISYFILGEFVRPEIYEFYGQWTPMKEFGIRGGQFKTPLSIENQLSLTALETVFNTRSVSSLIGMTGDVLQLYNGKNNTGRDVGLMAQGSLISRSDYSLIDYSVGIFQGMGMNTSEKNNSKDFAANILFQPVKGFRIGGGAYFGEGYYSLDGNPANEASHVRNRWIASSDYRNDRLYARAEWIKAKDGGIDKEGLYGLAKYYLLPQKLSVVGKVDYLNRDKNRGDEVIDYLFGVDYYFYKQCRMHVNYTYSDYSKVWGEKSSHNVVAQMQIVF